jgi:DNA-binding CsgD family transcriptional regulator
MMQQPTSADLTDVLTCLSELYGHCDEHAFPRRALQALRTLVPCDMAAFELQLDTEGKRAIGVSEPFEVHEDPLFAAFEQHMLEDPLVRLAHETGRIPIVSVSELMSRQDYESTGVYHDYFRHYGIRDRLAFSIGGEGPEVVGVALNRDRRRFSERDRRVIRIIRPHLIQAWRNAQAVSRLVHNLEERCVQRHEPMPQRSQNLRAMRQSWMQAAGLTPREADVLAEVAQGRTNKQIGHALSISARTVTKHLENVFPKLGVTTRAAAAALYTSCAPHRPPANHR